MASKPISPAVRKRFKESRIARLATVSATGRPHLVPICFAFDGRVFYFAIDRKPKRVKPERLVRIRNIIQTEQAALLFDAYSEDWNRLWYVLVRGRARVVKNGSERMTAIRMLRRKYRQYANGMLADDALVIRIELRSVASWGDI
jgi:PPOX class probable F420-dependent enzyme